MSSRFTTKPLTAANFSDMEAIFNARGCSVARGCWCMYYRKSGASEWPSARSEQANVNRKALKALAASGAPVGLIGQGVARALLDAAVAHCRKAGVKLVEGYPVDKAARTDDQNMWFGAKSMFDAAGFEEVARRKPERPIVRIHTR